jgi:hypothetical protein
MGLAVVTIAAGGLPVVEVAAYGLAVTEAASLRGIPVTKVTGGKPGLGVTFVTEAGVVVLPFTPTTLDPATVLTTTLSGGNLVATSTGTTTRHGAHALASAGKTSGKYYFEMLPTAYGETGCNAKTVGVGTTASTYTGMGTNGVVGVVFFVGCTTNNIYANSVNQVLSVIPSPVAGSWIGIAADLDSRKIWFRVNGGDWNGIVGNNPATGIGGVVIPAGTMIPFVTFGGTGGIAGTVFVLNFGGSAFSGTVPSGFTAGWG